MTYEEPILPHAEQSELDKLHQAQVVILDAGSQFCGQIDRAVRELGVRSEILPIDTDAEYLKGRKAIFISGGPDSVTEETARQTDPDIWDLGIPVLGSCYGMQIMAHQLGGTVGDSGEREDGKVNTALFADESLYKNIKGINQNVWMSHGDSVKKIPNGFEVIGGHDEMITAMVDRRRNLYGLQFHPEVDGTDAGNQMIENFLFEVARVEKDYEAEDQKTEAIAEICEIVGDRDVVMYLSGGVDSTVLALLMAEAIPDKTKVHAVHIDTGFMRADESETVQSALSNQGIELTTIDATDMFLHATTLIDGTETPPLSQITDPQVKRQIIGDTFAVLREQLIMQLGLSEDTVLAQGTLRPDIIESGSHLAGVGLATIKTHHNDTPAIRDLRSMNRVVEPIKGLYKDQVRAVGRELGLGEDFVMRQPFPGPGLAIRVICTEGGVQAREEHELNQIKLDAFLGAYPDLIGDIMPFETVGVQGDGRSYKSLAVLRSLGEIGNWSRLLEIADKIPRSVYGVNRVAFGFVNTAPADAATPTFLTPEVTGQLRHADAIVRAELSNAGLDHKLSQVPVILAPISFGVELGRSIALRPFNTRDFMTGKPEVPGEDIPLDVLGNIVERLLAEVPGVTQVLYDLSSKPPATTEWE